MDINKINNSFTATLQSTKNIEGNNQFKHIFDRTINEINAATSPSPVDSKNNILEQTDKILNLLDNYAGELANSVKTLKDIKPLVDNIEKEVNRFESEAANKFHGDKALDRIVEELAVTAKVAIYKFNRGDYI